MLNHPPYDLYALDSYSLAYHSLERFKQLIQREPTMPADIVEQIEDNLIPALEYIINWEPSDADIQAHIDTHGMF